MHNVVLFILMSDLNELFRLTVEEHLIFYGRMKGLSGVEAKHQAIM